MDNILISVPNWIVIILLIVLIAHIVFSFLEAIMKYALKRMKNRNDSLEARNEKLSQDLNELR